jgi:methyl-accepting chemotaxis protein
MTAQRLQEIKDIYKEAESSATKAEGAMEQLLAGLKSEHGLDSIEEAKTKLIEVEKQLTDLNTKIIEMTEELENVTDWDTI